jgi:hypothetical protein
MPATYSIDPLKRVVFTVFSGDVAEPDIRDMALRLEEDPEFHPDFSELVDLSAVTDFRLSAEDLQGISICDPFSSHAQRAFFSPQDLLFGICRMYEGIKGGNHMATFRSMTEARKWLDLY